MDQRRGDRGVHLSAMFWSSYERVGDRRLEIVVVRHRMREIEKLFEPEERGNVLMNATNEAERTCLKAEGINIVDLTRKRTPYLTLFRVDRCEMQAQPHTAR